MNKTGFWHRLVQLDPALLRGLVMATVFLLGTLGVVVTPELPDALVGWIAVVLAIVQALWTRGAVTPNKKVLVYVPDPIEKPNAVEAGEAVTLASTVAILEAAMESPR